MTPTDDLMRMLKERGVRYASDEYFAKKYPPEKRVTWSCDIAGETMTITAQDHAAGTDDNGDWVYYLDAEFHDLFTPEQLITITLERWQGECHMERFRDNHYSIYLDTYVCSECGEPVYVGTVMGESEPPKWCPGCGRRVVNDE